MAYSPQSKTVRLPSGASYCYLHIPPTTASPPPPTILFLHGFPSTAYDWRHQIAHFSSQGYGILAPDLLGYGGTDQPLEVTAYKMSKMANDVASILDYEHISEVVGVAHDWGAALLSKLLRTHANRFLAFAFLATYYTPANPYLSEGREFDAKAVQEMTIREYGFDAFSHTVFLAEADRAGKMIDGHLESFFTLVFPEEPSLFKIFRREGGIEEWIGNNKRGKMPTWVSEEEKTKILELWKLNNGFTPKCNWYKQLIDGISLEDGDDEPSSKLEKPILLIIETLDVPQRGESAIAAAQRVSLDVRVQRVETGHWIQLEDVQGTNRLLGEFFKDI